MNYCWLKSLVCGLSLAIAGNAIAQLGQFAPANITGSQDNPEVLSLVRPNDPL